MEVRHQQVEAGRGQEPCDLVRGRCDGLGEEARIVLDHVREGVLPVVAYEVDLVVAAQLARDPFAVARVVGVEQRGDVLEGRHGLDDHHGLEGGSEEQVRAWADGGLAGQLADDRNEDVGANLRRQMPGGEDVQPVARCAQVEVVNGAPGGYEAHAEASEVLLRVDDDQGALVILCDGFDVRCEGGRLPCAGGSEQHPSVAAVGGVDPDRPVLVAHDRVGGVAADRARGGDLPG